MNKCQQCQRSRTLTMRARGDLSHQARKTIRNPTDYNRSTLAQRKTALAEATRRELEHAAECGSDG